MTTKRRRTTKRDELRTAQVEVYLLRGELETLARAFRHMAARMPGQGDEGIARTIERTLARSRERCTVPLDPAPWSETAVSGVVPPKAGT